MNGGMYNFPPFRNFSKSPPDAHMQPLINIGMQQRIGIKEQDALDATETRNIANILQFSGHHMTEDLHSSAFEIFKVCASNTLSGKCRTTRYSQLRSCCRKVFRYARTTAYKHEELPTCQGVWLRSQTIPRHLTSFRSLCQLVLAIRLA